MTSPFWTRVRFPNSFVGLGRPDTKLTYLLQCESLTGPPCPQKWIGNELAFYKPGVSKMHTKQSSTYHTFVTKFLLALPLLWMPALVGCGGAAAFKSNSNFGGAVPGSSSVQVRITDAPSDRVIALGLTLSSVKAISSSGAQYDLLPGPGSVEVTHLAATNEPLAVLDVPQGEYTQMEVSVSGAQVTYLDASTNQPVEKQFSDSLTVTVALNPPITIGAEPSVLNIDVDVANTVYLDLANNSVNVNPPVLRVSSQPVLTSGEQHPEDGRVEHVLGSVSSVSGSSFTLSLGHSGMSLTFQTDENTTFDAASLSMLTGAKVEVSGSSQADGSLLASRIRNLGSGNDEVVIEGLMTGFTDSGYLSLVSQDGSGAGMAGDLLGSSIGLNLDGGATYAVDTHDFDMEGLPFVFAESSIMPGQRVAVGSHSSVQPDPQGGATGFIDATVVELQQQTLNGTVSNYAPAETPGTATFDLVLPGDGTSYLSASNPGTMVVHVYQRSTTDVHGLSGAVSDGQSVQVRGLLFYYNPAIPSSSRKTKASTAGIFSQPFFFVAGRIKGLVVPPM